MRVLLAGIFAALLPIHGVVAEEIRLRCDPISSNSAPVLLSLDMSLNKVHVGTDEKSGWYRDGARYKHNDGDSPGGACTVAFTGCIYDMKQTVSISETKITFGESGKNLNSCGAHNYDCGYGLCSCRDNGRLSSAVGAREDSRWFTIDRNTGIYTDDNRDRFQCTVFTGKVIP